MRILPYILTAAVAFAAKPTQSVSIKSSQLEVVLDPLKGLPVEYRLGSKATMRGGVSSEVTVTIFRSNPPRYTNYAVRPEVIRATKSHADFQFIVREKGAPMASFMVRYDLTGAELDVSLEAVLEEAGFELMDVGLADLAEVSDQDASAWLSHGEGGGTLAWLKTAKDGHIGPTPTLPIVMIGANRMLCVEEVLSPSDTAALAVEHHQARLGTVKVWRVKGESANRLIGGRPLCRLDFSGDVDRNGSVDWLDGAKLVRSRMPQIPSHELDDKVMYAVAAGADAAKIERSVKMLTGGAPLSTLALPGDLRYASIGKFAATAHGPSGEISPFGGEAIPLTAAIYRKSAIWGLRGEEWKKQPELNSFFYNGRDIPVLGGDDWERQFAAFYYGILVPWYQVHDRNIEAYLRDGDRTVLSLEGNSRIDLDWKTDQYSIAVAGVEIARDGDTVCPIGQDRVAFYSHAAKTFSAPIPDGWDANAVVAMTLFADKPERTPVSTRDGKLTVSVQPERPVMVYRDAQAVPR
ncbi:MAG TPA: hypothetical protein VMT15_07840 [Bryobacteraceae bacterium]|nr:hypothetical protein [Bryobacteraceae bacterium]